MKDSPVVKVSDESRVRFELRPGVSVVVSTVDTTSGSKLLISGDNRIQIELCAENVIMVST